MTQGSKPAIFFDLDGTLTDSGEGIMKCAALALQYFKLPIPCPQDMRTFVGPPLTESFIRLGVPADKADDAVEIYRSRYNTVGKFENIPYPGIANMLQSLQAKGFRLFVATSKPESLSIEILEHFSLSQYFEKICGASLDSSRSKKADVIAYLLANTNGIGQAIMVGDTAFDVLGAAQHNIPAVGVSWGYGLTEDMRQAGAVTIVDSPEALESYLTQMLEH